MNSINSTVLKNINLENKIIQITKCKMMINQRNHRRAISKIIIILKKVKIM